jgi:hypothetical protein
MARTIRVTGRSKVPQAEERVNMSLDAYFKKNKGKLDQAAMAGELGVSRSCVCQWMRARGLRCEVTFKYVQEEVA